MAHFFVDSPSLRAVRDRLGALHEQLLALPVLIGGLDGRLGGRGLEELLGGIGAHWHHLVTDLGGEITDVMQRLATAADAYERIDGGVAGHASRTLRSPSGSGTTVIAPVSSQPRPPSQHPAAAHRPGHSPSRPRHPLSGSGITVVGPPSSSSASGSGTTVVGPPPSSPQPKSGSGVTVID